MQALPGHKLITTPQRPLRFPDSVLNFDFSLSDLGIILNGGASLNGMVFLADGADLLGILNRSACAMLITDLKQPKHALTSIGEHRLAFDEASGNVTKVDIFKITLRFFVSSF